MPSFTRAPSGGPNVSAQYAYANPLGGVTDSVVAFQERKEARQLAEQKMIQDSNIANQKAIRERNKEIFNMQKDYASAVSKIGEAKNIDELNAYSESLDIIGNGISQYTGSQYAPAGKWKEASIATEDGTYKTLAIPENIDERMVSIGKNGQWYKVDGDGKRTDEEVQIPFKDFSISDSDDLGKGGDYASIDGVKGYYSRADLAKATADGKKVIELKTPTDSNGTPKRDSLEQKHVALQNRRQAEIDFQNNPTEENRIKLKDAREIYDSTVKGKSEASEYDEKTDIKAALNYGRSLSQETYSQDDAMDIELDFKYTKAYQQNTQLKNEEDEFNNAVVTYNQTKSLSDALSSAVADGSYKSGIIDSTIKKVASYTTKEFSSLIKLDRESIKEQIGLEGKIGDAVAQYLKNLSGTAASQAEFERTLNNFVGSDMLNEDIRAKKLRSFTEKKKADLDKRAKQLAKRGLVSTSGEWLYGSNTSPAKTEAEQPAPEQNPQPSTYKLDVNDAWEKILKKRQGL